MDGINIIGIGGGELFIIMLLAVIVLGPDRLARTAREAGKLIRNVKAYFGSLSDELKSELQILDEVNEVNKEIKKLL